MKCATHLSRCVLAERTICVVLSTRVANKMPVGASLAAGHVPVFPAGGQQLGLVIAEENVA